MYKIVKKPPIKDLYSLSCSILNDINVPNKSIFLIIFFIFLLQLAIY